MLENKNESYFRKLIKGQISLNTTFWIWFVFLTLAINIFIGATCKFSHKQDS